jgi:hypothetical protein
MNVKMVARGGRLILFASLFFVAAVADAVATVAETKPTAAKGKPDDLFRRVEALDRAVFDAFNRCELGTLESFFAPELEFYHDKAGVTWTRDEFMQNVKKNVCGKFRRELVAETLEVWPLGDYGAVYSGTHRFCQFASGKCEGSGKFMHIWRNQGGDWKMTRVISYDHKSVP